MRGSTASGEMAGGNDIKASANMWALLSDNNPGHSEAVAVKQRLDGAKAKDKGPAAGDRWQAMASGEPESSGLGGDASRYYREDKQTRKERNKKQKKPQAAASGEAVLAPVMMSTNGEAHMISFLRCHN